MHTHAPRTRRYRGGRSIFYFSGNVTADPRKLFVSSEIQCWFWSVSGSAVKSNGLA